MTEKLKSLYQSVILEHHKHPVGFEKRPEAAYVLEAYNPICGDRFTLFFELEDQRIKEMHFHGYGCAISKASTSVLVENLRGKTLAEVEILVQQFFKTVKGESEAGPQAFSAFAAAQSFPGRMKCATLSWDEFEQFLNDRK